MNNEKKIKGYKGFNPDLTCRDFKYEVGKEYQTDKAKTCETGFHFCENPFDVWNYYPPCDEKGQLNRFCKVEGSGDIDNSHSDKIACSHINVNAEIGLQGIINAGVKFIMDKVSRTGRDSMAKGAPGCWIVLTERGDWDGTTYPIKCVKAFKVDGEKIKAGTFYKLENGEAVEVKE